MKILFIFLLLAAAVFSLARMAGSRGIGRVDALAAKDMVEKDGAVVIDVRTPREFREGHIQGAVLMPLARFGEGIGGLAPFKERPVLVYCVSGSRSMAACRMLRRNGFTRVFNLRGGIYAWAQRGFDAVKDS